MTDQEENLYKIENEAERFPSQMLLIRNVFQFSYAEAEKVTEAFDCNTDLLATISQAIQSIEASELDDDSKNDLIHLLREEADVIAYSQTARCSVISM